MTEYLILLPVKVPAQKEIPEAIFPDAEFGSRERLPMHCTVMPWFIVESKEQFIALSNELSFLACGINMGEIELVSGKVELFGQWRNVRAHVLRHTNRLLELHEHLLRFLKQRGIAPQDCRHVGRGYWPHVSDVRGRTFATGKRFFPEQLVLVERGPGQIKRIRNIYRFGRTAQTT